MPPRRRNRNQDRQREQNDHEEREVTPPPLPHRRIEELFLRQNPPSFNGTGSPDDAESWVRAMERIFNFLHCTAQEKMTCVTFQLLGAADYWWEAKRKLLTPEQLENFSWEDFKVGMYEKYIPKSYRRRKETEFYHLKQGKTTVTEYERAFCNMSRYAPQQVDTEEKMSDKFCSGLRPEIRITLAGQGQMNYTEALSRALDIEAAMPEEKPTPATSVQTGDKGKRKWEGNTGGYQQKRPWQGNTAPQGQHQAQGQVQGQSQGQGQRVVPNQNANAPKMKLCPKCQKPHSGVCLAGLRVCYKCGQEGHIARVCPNQKPGENQKAAYLNEAQPLRAVQGYPQQQQQSGYQPQQQHNQKKDQKKGQQEQQPQQPNKQALPQHNRY